MAQNSFRIINGPNGCVALLDVRSNETFIPLRHYEAHTKVKRGMPRLAHFTNQSTRSMLDALKQYAPGVVHPNAPRITVLKASHVRDMYLDDDWLYDVCNHQMDVPRVGQKRDRPNTPPKKQVFFENDSKLTEADLQKIRKVVRDEFFQIKIEEAKRQAKAELLQELMKAE